jgi:predicted amidohydrolase YtcJ
MRGLHNAVNRQTIDGQPPGGWFPEQRVSVATALRAYTISGAYASFEESTKGKIAPGMFSDIIVLTANPFAVNPAKLYQTRVAMTIFDGRVNYQLK